jgi:hypothetical protein
MSNIPPSQGHEISSDIPMFVKGTLLFFITLSREFILLLSPNPNRRVCSYVYIGIRDVHRTSQEIYSTTTTAAAASNTTIILIIITKH